MPGPGLELIGDDEIAEVLDALRNQRLSRYGKPGDTHFRAKVRTLEERVAAYVGVRFAVGVNSGTSALLVAMAGLEIGPGDEVIVPGFTFVASISSIVYSRALPVLAEVDETLNLDPHDVAKRITPRTKAIIAVHMLGNPARLAELKALADERGIALIEDCAQGFGGTYRGKKVGSIGSVGTISFNEYKTITAGDGGMVVTDDENLYRRIFAMHDQGHSPLRNDIEVGRRPFMGLNFRMVELSAAVLLAQLRRLDGILAKLRENKALFKSLIADLPGLRFRELPDPAGDIATHLVVLFPTAAIATAVSAELGSRTLGDSGWHIYSKMEHLLTQRTATGRGCPFDCGCYFGASTEYRAGMLPQTDALVARAMTIGIGIADATIGSNFGVTILDGADTVRERAAEFRRVAAKHL